MGEIILEYNLHVQVLNSSSFQWTLVFHFTLEQQVKLTCSFALNGYTLATLAPGIQKLDKIITI